MQTEYKPNTITEINQSEFCVYLEDGYVSFIRASCWGIELLEKRFIYFYPKSLVIF